MLKHFRLIVLLLAAWVASGCSGEAPIKQPLNLILISLDTVRADRLSFYGYDLATTQHLDAFADTSVLFGNCVAQSTATAASHMSIFTGQYVHRHGLADNTQVRFPGVTLASVLRDHGWRTAAFTGGGSLRATLGHDVGFDLFRSDSESGPMHPSRNLPEVVPEALRWLDEPSREPFFLFVHGYDPHCPYSPPEPWLSERLGPDRGEFDLELQKACGMREWGPLMAGDGFGDDELERLDALYDAELAAADDALGKFFAALEARNLLDRSIIVFTSDHGELLGEHGWVGHTRLWENEIRVPLLIRFPGGRFARRLDDPVQHIDLLPTLLASLGVEAPEGVQGMDLMPLIRDQISIPAPRMRITQIGKRVAVRFADGLKIVAGPDDRNVASAQPQGPQIYDLDGDPSESLNLYETPEGRKRYDALWNRYRIWRRETSEDDVHFAGTPRPLSDAEQHEKMLKALGYVSDDTK